MVLARTDEREMKPYQQYMYKKEKKEEEKTVEMFQRPWARRIKDGFSPLFQARLQF